MKQLLLTLILATLASLNGSAQTPVSGTIVGQTWTTAESPYHIVGPILVAGLSIQPGVVIEAQGNYAFEVAGILTAVGTDDQPILFQSADTLTTGWQGIFFNFSSPGSIMTNCDVSGSINSGIRIDNARPTIQGCAIHANSASFGGGIRVIAGTKIAIEECDIFNNSVTGGSGIGGGGVYAACDTIVLTGCRIHHNTVSASGDDTVARGGGVYLQSNVSELSCTIIHRNRCFAFGTVSFANAYASGGGLCSYGRTSLQNVVLQYNLLHSQGAGSAWSYGGGAYLEGHADLTNCIASHDTLVTLSGFFGSPHPGGGGIWMRVDSGCNVLNSTFAFNPAQGLGADQDSVHVSSSILWENEVQLSAIARVQYSDVQDGWPGQGVLNQNPIFFNDSMLQIVPGSPCIDTGDPDPSHDDACFPPSHGNPRNDMGAHGGSGGCTWQIDPPTCPFFSFDFPLSVAAEHSMNLVLWPNPFSNELQISGYPQNGIAVRVSDAYGRVVRMFNTTPERSFWDGRTASGTEVPPGIYFVTVVTQDGQRYTQRVIKQ